MVTGVVTAAPVELTADGRALLAELATAVAPVTHEVFADLDRADLAVAHRVLVELIQRPNDDQRCLPPGQPAAAWVTMTAPNHLGA